jgi:hypothetical protein
MHQIVLIFSFLLILIYLPMHDAGGCYNNCNGHGYCGDYSICVCSRGPDGEFAFTGADCSQRTCPKGTAWIGHVVGANDIHPSVECSNKGLCDRQTGTCQCYDNYEGLACERTVCPFDCNGRGECYTAKQLAEEAGTEYSTPWDSKKHVGCVCDFGYRGVGCQEIECQSKSDVMKGFGNEAGRDCSGRGTCNYQTGRCKCFIGYEGGACETRTAAMFF